MPGWFSRCIRPLVLSGVALVQTAAGNTPSAAADNPAFNRWAPTAVLLAPTQGRPVFVEPEQSFRIVAQIPTLSAEPRFVLVSRRYPPHEHLLEPDADAGRILVAGQPQELRVPAGVPAQTYDLEIRCGTVQLTARHGVAVGRIGSRIRLVHLSNMNIGDAGAPVFDQRLIDEVNLVSPTLVVATGDYLDVTHSDRNAGWAQLTDFFARFDAPALMACGDHDDMELYSRYIAPSPIDLVRVGPYLGVVLFDHPRRPIDQDAAQIRWVERALAPHEHTLLSFVVSHDESPNLLRYWQRQGTLADVVHSARLGLWFAGGHRDWDGCEYRALVDDAHPLLLLRTHQASSAAREAAQGVSHYRIVDLDGEHAWLPQGDPTSGGVAHSTAVGRLGVTWHGPNDGSQAQLSFTALNNLPHRLNGLTLRVLLKRAGDDRPWCLGGTIERLVNLGEMWECRVMFDLPDKGSLKAVVGTGPTPWHPVVRADFGIQHRLTLARRVSADGVTYLSALDQPGTVRLRNDDNRTVDIRPLVRLDGNPIAYRLSDGERPFATAYGLRLAAGAEATLQLDLSAIRVNPGRRELQVYVTDSPVRSPTCFPLDVHVTETETARR
ncbi:MAG: hypothetical protein KKB50_00780 [Planctomycetes bacterium]|nr:hypothetical protein [Planctomycetota bacterium]